LLAADVVISEFMAANQQTLEDGFNQSADWIELYNRGDETADLSKLFLTDDPDNLNKWSFPTDSELVAGGYLLVFASRLDTVDPDGNAHTNFSLSPSGDYLALANERFEVLSEFGANGDDYPKQFADVAYGLQGAVGRPIATDVPQTISSSQTSTITSSITVASAGIVTDVNLTIDITHGWVGDLNITLISPLGTRVELISGVGGSGDDFRNTTLDDEGLIRIVDDVPPFTGTFSPEQPLSTFDGEVAAGQWTLEVYDDFPAEGGRLEGWSLDLTTNEASSSEAMVGFLLQPTPGSPNSPDVANIGPWISDVTEPNAPITGDQALIVTADVSDRYADSASVDLFYRVMYGDERQLTMRDDGTAGDAVANDGRFTALIPPNSAVAGEMVRWRIVARDTEGRESRSPAFLDASGEDQSPEYYGTVVADAQVESQVPIWHWYIEPGTEGRADSRTGARASLFYANEFYDNVFVRVRGGSSTGLPKKSYKFDFNTAHDFRFAEDAGRVREINLNTTYSNKDYIRQALAFQTYDAAGLPGSEAFPVRVQQNGEFYSVAIVVEQPDADMLERENLDPDGALYKMFNTFTSGTSGVEKKTREYESNADLVDFTREIGRLSGDELRNYVFDNVNIPAVMNYLAGTVITQNNDQMAKNYFVYRDTNGTGEWLVMPWDLDLTFGLHFMTNDSILDDMMCAKEDQIRTVAGVEISPSHPYVGTQELPANRSWNRLIDKLYDIPEFREMYLRRLRSLMDQLLQSPETPTEELWFESRLDAYRQRLASDVALDEQRWANPWPWGEDQSFEFALQRIKDEYLEVRRQHLYETHSIDNLTPQEIEVLIPEFAMSWAQWMEVEHGRAYMCEFSWRSERGPMTQCQVYFPGQNHVLCATFSRLGPFTSPDKESVLRFMHSYHLMPERAQ